MMSVFSTMKHSVFYIKRNGLFATCAKMIRKINFSKRYKKWINDYEKIDKEQIVRDIKTFSYLPTFSICVPVYNVEEKWLRKCIQSVQNQYYTNWQLCMADDCSPDEKVRTILRDYARKDDRINIVYRIQNGHISEATNSALQIASGEFIVLMDNDDELAPNALYEVAKILQKHRDLDIIYSDEDKIDEDGNRNNPYFKPGYCPDTLLSYNYISHMGVYRRILVEQTGGFRKGVEGAQDYDLLLRVLEMTENIYHIPKILYHWRAIPGSTALDGEEKNYAYIAGKKVLEDTIKRRKYSAEAKFLEGCPCYNVIFHPQKKHFYSIIIAVHDQVKELENCLKSIEKNVTETNYEVILIDCQSKKKKVINSLDKYNSLPLYRVIKMNQNSFYSVINNLAVKKAKGDLIVFLNPEVEILTKKWLPYMAGEAEREKVGAVGTKILHPRNLVHNAGFRLDKEKICVDIGNGRRKNESGYMYYLSTRRNYSAVSGDCLMIRKDIFEQAGGFDENLKKDFCDIDLCLKLQNMGYRNIFMPDIEVYLNNKKPNLKAFNKRKNHEETFYMKKKWNKVLLEDPCSSRVAGLDPLKV